MEYPFYIINRRTHKIWRASAEEAYVYISKKFGLKEFYFIAEEGTQKIVGVEDVITLIAAHEYKNRKAGRIIPPALAERIRISKEKK